MFTHTIERESEREREREREKERERERKRDGGNKKRGDSQVESRFGII